MSENKNQTEKDQLLYVELPNLINRIMKLAVGRTPDEGIAHIFAEEIKKVSNAELDSALNTVKMLSANLVSDEKYEDKCPSFTPEDSTGRKYIGPSMECPY
ncbi:hypothetical protein GMB34_13495 [Turicibacter sanguinis]|uniref:hypothetical protein n=1 Tax=Turicibacter sanguinis TaxID=154288 RepID=UPI0012BD369E|nr:hypothetical protein [Turicibacter sanguinis]MDB8436741.1 hypothetical protein [Turicibacter sanguinis]MTN80713.1 hypothetical protein [Turicibacter sanguinis]MTN85229.1 hypothetical protein [Turicibacter sanguinis]MTN88050.1 hypothetical protein [Turicibacter sanguinis]MTN90904.1 hypothetical protein [Turicibacter sanguinis]